MTVIIDGTTGIQVPDGSGSVPSYSNDGDGNTGLFFPAADTIAFAEGGAEVARFDSSGNLGLGTTSPAYKLDTNTASTGTIARFVNGTGRGYVRMDGYSDMTLQFYRQGASVGFFQTDSSGTEFLGGTTGAYPFILYTNNAERARITSGGLMGLGTASPASAGGVAFVVYDSSTPRIRLTNSTTGEASTDGAELNLSSSDFIIENREAGATRFYTNGSERARITAGGFFKASNDGTYFSSTGNYHECRNNAADWTLLNTNTNASNPFGVYIRYTATDPNGTINSFVQCLGTTTLRAEIRSNGGLVNYQANDVNLSDERVKTDIKPVGSYWSKIKAIEIVTFKYKDQTHDDDNVGVIAQQVESVAPEFVDVDGFGETPEDGVPLKTIYTTDMYHAAIKALQEAMLRIEQLEAKVAALEGK